MRTLSRNTPVVPHLSILKIDFVLSYGLVLARENEVLTCTCLAAERGQETGLELRLSLSAAMQQKFQATVAKAGKIGKASNGDTRRHSTRARFQRTSSDEKDKTKSEPGNLDDTIRLLAAESAADLCSDFKLVVVQSTSTIGAGEVPAAGRAPC